MGYNPDRAAPKPWRIEWQDDYDGTWVTYGAKYPRFLQLELAKDAARQLHAKLKGLAKVRVFNRDTQEAIDV